MARIRSIKPDFFTSETIAALPLSARLTFIGLWTHVDDNGVSPDNPRLITAAIWPLEDDPLESLRRTREDLLRLQEKGRITRYEVLGKRYLFITSWAEHQKISHPAKPRYPLPTEPGANVLTSTDAIPLELRPSPPEDRQSPPEILAPDQGAGSREQGKTLPQRAPAKRATTVLDDDPDFTAFWSAYPRKVGKGGARKAWPRALAKGTDPKEIIAGAERYRDHPVRRAGGEQFTAHPETWLNREQWADQLHDHANGTGNAALVSEAPWMN